METINVVIMMGGLVLNTLVIVMGVTKIALKFTERLSIIETEVKNIMEDMRLIRDSLNK